MKRAPFAGGDEIEIRQVFAAEDFGEALTPELREQEERLRRRPRRSNSVIPGQRSSNPESEIPGSASHRPGMTATEQGHPPCDS